MNRMNNYGKYERSTAEAPFEDYSLENEIGAWIDLRGIRSASHEKIVAAVKKVLDLAAEFSATGTIWRSWHDGVFV